MTVPALEIDDVVLSDTTEIVRYLREHYPVDPQPKEVGAFVDLVDSWNEILWNYSHATEQGHPVNTLNKARLFWLRHYRAEAVKHEPELLEVYDKKISYVQNLSSAIDHDE